MKLFKISKKSKLITFMISVMLILVYFYPGIVFYPMGSLLLRDDLAAKNADHLIVLMGEPQVRPSAAAKAALSGYAQKVLFVASELNPLEEAGLVPSEEMLSKSMILRTGLEEQRIEIIENYGRATSTADEAIIIRKYFESKGSLPHRIIVMTSWPHSSRAGWIMDKAFANTHTKIEMMPIAHIPFGKHNWWQSERGLLFVFEEYIKWARYLIKFLGRDVT